MTAWEDIANRIAASYEHGHTTLTDDCALCNAEYDALMEATALLHAQSGVDTPDCDCGHQGMGAAWHLKPCPHAR